MLLNQYGDLVRLEDLGDETQTETCFDGRVDKR